jgi:hypothetical protein
MVHRIERIVLFSLYVPFWGVQLEGSCRQWKDLMIDLESFSGGVEGEGGGWVLAGEWGEGEGGGEQLSICYRKRILIMTRSP